MWGGHEVLVALVLLLPALEEILHREENHEDSPNCDENRLDNGERASEHQSRQVRINEGEDDETAGERPQNTSRTAEEKTNPLTHVVLLKCPDSSLHI